ncbi:MAG: dihydropteroate synthase [Candidatus Latescibacterota bacterium]|nr:dihydropteroate synthase [Candidatus Latescibacterota bacterium]
MAAQVFRCGDRSFDLTSRTHVMGVLNVTPDSFSDGGLYFDPEAAILQASLMIEEGADIIDIGGESSRPAGPYGRGAEAVSEEEEKRRTAPVIEAIASRFDTPISIDTVKADVARTAIDAGATIVNDISGLKSDSGMLEIVSSRNASIVIMHMKGIPQTMQKAPTYKDLISEIFSFLRESASTAISHGVEKDKIAIDPGLGFGKTYEQNYEIIRSLQRFLALDHPLLVGPSRKTFVGVDFALPPGNREEGSLAASVLCARAGAHFIRVHNVKATRRALFVADRIRFLGGTET